MIARFVQIKPAELKALLDDPESVESVFQEASDDEGSGALPPAAATKAMENLRKLMESRGPALLSGALPGMDPKIRQALIERLARLGVNAEALEGGKGGESGGLPPPNESQCCGTSSASRLAKRSCRRPHARQ